ncbi:hypothetical protein [Pseudonocardia asaccharolytica]|uniref:Uncharacterized protein n=1 Tax=Pseudonocardia asaccharolytica DSM 44247 = NBRC 16224 TaxID=1123024 RepID=A0A511DB77_9PSEU|nr:hypothetical protein PA7_47510 [Pseudonocardia asaccharolytica DSM 44247 = NBRC 16224]
MAENGVRDQDDVAVVGAGFRVSRAMAHRYRDEVLTVLATQAPDLHEALRRLPIWVSHVVPGTGTTSPPPAPSARCTGQRPNSGPISLADGGYVGAGQAFERAVAARGEARKNAVPRRRYAVRRDCPATVDRMVVHATSAGQAVGQRKLRLPDSAVL